MKEYENVYVKDGKRYRALGLSGRFDYLPDGIYFIRHRSDGKHTTSVPYIEGLFKIADPEKISMATVCGMQDVCDAIEESQEWKEMLRDKTGFSLDQVVHLCVKKLFEMSNDDNKSNE